MQIANVTQKRFPVTILDEYGSVELDAAWNCVDPKVITKADALLFIPRMGFAIQREKDGDKSVSLVLEDSVNGDVQISTSGTDDLTLGYQFRKFVEFCYDQLLTEIEGEK